jgi:hypothetical protein
LADADALLAPKLLERQVLVGRFAETETVHADYDLQSRQLGSDLRLRLRLLSEARR